MNQTLVPLPIIEPPTRTVNQESVFLRWLISAVHSRPTEEHMPGLDYRRNIRLPENGGTSTQDRAAGFIKQSSSQTIKIPVDTGYPYRVEVTVAHVFHDYNNPNPDYGGFIDTVVLRDAREAEYTHSIKNIRYLHEATLSLVVTPEQSEDGSLLHLTLGDYRWPDGTAQYRNPDLLFYNLIVYRESESEPEPEPIDPTTPITILTPAITLEGDRITRLSVPGFSASRISHYMIWVQKKHGTNVIVNTTQDWTRIDGPYTLPQLPSWVGGTWLETRFLVYAVDTDGEHSLQVSHRLSPDSDTPHPINPIIDYTPSFKVHDNCIVDLSVPNYPVANISHYMIQVTKRYSPRDETRTQYWTRIDGPYTLPELAPVFGGELLDTHIQLYAVDAHGHTSITIDQTITEPPFIPVTDYLPSVTLQETRITALSVPDYPAAQVSHYMIEVSRRYSGGETRTQPWTRINGPYTLPALPSQNGGSLLDTSFQLYAVDTRGNHSRTISQTIEAPFTPITDRTPSVTVQGSRITAVIVPNYPVANLSHYMILVWKRYSGGEIRTQPWTRIGAPYTLPELPSQTGGSWLSTSFQLYAVDIRRNESQAITWGV